jgi:CMP-N-acetylneuraminic acid synthetase
MKIVAIIPIKSKSSRVKRKNFIKIKKNKPLYKFFLEKVLKCNFDQIFVDTDSIEIINFCNKRKINIIKRKKSLAQDNANGNDLLNYHAKIIKSDLYFQLFITAPLLSVETINKCIYLLKMKKKFDSIFTCHKIFSWFWFNDRPINYKPKILPRSQDAKPIVMETTGLYGIRKKTLKKHKCRIGQKPYFFEVSKKESLDLDTKEDFKILKTYL